MPTALSPPGAGAGEERGASPRQVHHWLPADAHCCHSPGDSETLPLSKATEYKVNIHKLICIPM